MASSSPSSPSPSSASPEAAALLAALTNAEARQDLPACAAHLRRLAAALRAPETRADLQETLTTWLVEGLGLVTPPTVEDAAGWREAVWDSAVDVVADGPGLADFLDLAASRLDGLPAQARPHLLSMLRARAHWRARDRMRRRAMLRSAPAEEGAAQDVQARLVAALAVQRIARRFETDPRLTDILERLLRGETISEISTASGLSRQGIYRNLARVRDWLTDVRTQDADALPFEAGPAAAAGGRGHV